ncbi:MAG: DUF370 domain-containing protein [Succiniclasticum sp.]|jgi:hypothetical protein|nr:DUF370 domain-containing protein [Succiniclasticum sp.]MCI6221989.1 DUF370 domain-containing protein [Selenomonadales bacterium]MDY6303254.1 DUF370 domain-containing protein [Succiniclasticum sp.]MDY6346635.1 DUF370 domain-containing protein [Succiniclasticum sp.]
MYVHLGTGKALKSPEIIGVFSVGGTASHQGLRRRDGRPYDQVDCTGGSGVSSFVLTDEKIYLSAISAATLQKRVNRYMTDFEGGKDE